MISIDTIKAARDGDFEATRRLIDDMSDRVRAVASRAASRHPGSFEVEADEFRQVANVALWEAVSSFDGDDADHFCGYAYARMERAIKESVASESHVVRWHLDAFTKAMENSGHNLDMATKLVQIHPYSTHGCMSAAVAYAAREAWCRSQSLDEMITSGGEGIKARKDSAEVATTDTIDYDELSVAPATPARIKAAFQALEDYVTVSGDPEDLFEACRVLSAGIVTATHLDILSENLHLPRNRRERLAVQGAFGILAAAVKSAEHTATPADEYNDRSEEHPEAKATVARRQTFNVVFDALSEGYRVVLAHTYGLRGAFRYGTDDKESADDEGMSAETGMSLKQITDARSRGKKSFAKRWIKIMARSEKHAADLEAEAKKNQRAGGYKLSKKRR